jgi:hypothetical protein
LDPNAASPKKLKHSNYGATVQAQLNHGWTLSAGIFRSINDSPVSYADLYVNTLLTGEADRLLIGYPDLRTASTSGDIRLAGQFPPAERFATRSYSPCEA